MVKVTQKLNGQEVPCDIKGDLKTVLHFLKTRAPLPSLAIYELKNDGFTRFRAGRDLVEIDIEPLDLIPTKDDESLEQE